MRKNARPKAVFLKLVGIGPEVAELYFDDDTWTIFLSTMKIGRFAFWWQIPATGCLARKLFYLPDGSIACNGTIPVCISNSQEKP